VKLSDLLGARIATENGDQLGHVFDVRVERAGDDPSAGEWRVKALVVGTRGVFERLGMRSAGDEPLLDRDVVPWDAVVGLELGEVLVREGTRPGR
jgi:sporulation protein YlmC with PRC-barrel domain